MGWRTEQLNNQQTQAPVSRSEWLPGPSYWSQVEAEERGFLVWPPETYHTRMGVGWNTAVNASKCFLYVSIEISSAFPFFSSRHIELPDKIQHSKLNLCCRSCMERTYTKYIFFNKYTRPSVSVGFQSVGYQPQIENTVSETLFSNHGWLNPWMRRADCMQRSVTPRII